MYYVNGTDHTGAGVSAPAPAVVSRGSETNATCNGNGIRPLETVGPFVFRKAVKRDAKLRLAVVGPGGSGKCLGKGTPVLMYDGSVVPVEEIVEGDVLMGPDSKPRTVWSTTTGHGPLYRIVPIKGDPWVCNDVHVLTLAGTSDYLGEIRDVPLNEYLQESTNAQEQWMLYRCGVEFPQNEERDMQVEPYFLGLWLGDGTTTATHITNRDPEVLDYLEKWAERHDVLISVTHDRRNSVPLVQFACRTQHARHRPLAVAEIPEEGLSLRQREVATLLQEGRTNREIAASLRIDMRSAENHVHQVYAKLLGSDTDRSAANFWLRSFLLERCRTDQGKHIPFEYLTASREDRLALLAGLIDTDGYVYKGCCEISTKWPHLASQILFLARSLGFAAYSSIKTVRLDGNRTRDYQRITISGDLDEVPVLIERKKAVKREQIKRVNVTAFRAEAIGDGEYYGFTLDGDGRFLLGDFTVTHNTYTLLKLATELGGRIAMVDTEHGSAEKYADLFEFDVLHLDSYDPAIVPPLIAAVAQQGYSHLLIDSWSHFWCGEGGELEQVDQITARTKSSNSWAAWRHVSPKHNRMIDAMLSAPIHILVSMRVKTEWVIEKDEKTGKTSPRKVGLQPVMRDGVEYEFDVCGDMDQENHLVITKSRCPKLTGAVIHKPGGEMAATLREWLGSSVPAKPVGSAPGNAGVLKHWTTRGEMKRLFGAVREQIGEFAYLSELERFGVKDANDFRAVEKAVECYERLLQTARKEVA